jgi:hypothetical protein
MSTDGSMGGAEASVTLDDSQVQAGVARLKQAMDQTGEAMRRLQADFAAGKVSVDQFEAEITQLSNEMSRAQSAAQSFGVSISASGQRTQAAVRGITDFSRAAEDFSTGGFLGVMNNIPGVMTNVGAAIGVSATSMALLTAGTSILVAGGYLLYRNWDSVTSLFQDKNPFPKTTDSIEGLTDAIKTNDKALDELRKKEMLNNEEMAKANKLLAENVQLEKQLEVARERRKNVKSIMESVSPEQEEKAQAFKTAATGRGEEVRNGIIAHFERQRVDRNQKTIDDMNRRIAEQMAAGDVAGARETRKREMGFVAKSNAVDSGAMADELISDIMQGRQGSFEKFQGIMNAPGMRDMFSPELRNRMRTEDPATKKQGEQTTVRKSIDDWVEKKLEEKELEDYDKEADAFQRQIDARRDAIKRRQDRKKRSDKIESEGKKEEQEAVNTAKEALPGIDQLTEQAFLEARASGLDTDKASDAVRQRVKRELMAEGMDEEGASRASRSLTIEASKKVQEQAVRKRLGMGNDRNGQEQQEEQKFSQVFGGSDLSNRIQSGVTNKDEQHQRKMESLTDQIYKVLAEKIPQEIAKARGLRAKITR